MGSQALPDIGKASRGGESWRMLLEEGVVFQGEETAWAEAIGGKDPMHFDNSFTHVTGRKCGQYVGPDHMKSFDSSEDNREPQRVYEQGRALLDLSVRCHQSQCMGLRWVVGTGDNVKGIILG